MAKTATSFQIERAEGDLLVTYAPTFTSCGDLWLKFEKQAICTPYQRFAYCRSWFEAQNDKDLALCAFLISDHTGAPQMFVPMVISTWHNSRIARFIGDSHTNFGAPIFQPGTFFSERLLKTIFEKIVELAGIDTFVLDKMPLTWRGSDNPLIVLKHRRCALKAFYHVLNADADETLRTMRSPAHLKQLRAKTRKLMESGHVEIGEALRAGERAEALQRFLKQKSEWCKAEGLHDIFAEKSTQAFLRGVLDEPELMRLYTLRYNYEIRAVFIGLQHKNEFCGWASSYISDELAGFSPGDILLQHVITLSCRDNIRHFDLGAGDAAYKMRWLHEDLPLATVFMGMNFKGRMAAFALGILYELKAALKNSPMLLKLARKLSA